MMEDLEGQTPLMIASSKGYTNCTRVLEGFEKQESQDSDKRRSLNMNFDRLVSLFL